MMGPKIFALVGAFLLAAASPASAAVVTVNTGTDPIDIDWQTATIADLPGPDGKVSFSEAMIVTNNTPGPDVIGFAIPQNEWTFQYLYPGCAVVQSSYTFFWRAYDAVTIDGTTQTAFTGDTNPNGAELVLFSSEVYFNVDGCTLQGVNGGSVTFNGSNNTAVGNTGGINITVYGGTGTLLQNNVCGTIKIDRSGENIVIGNTAARVRVLGWVGGGQPATNNRVGGPLPADRNVITGLGTWNSEGWPSGFAIQIFDAAGTVIENNSIGTTADGLAQGHQATTEGIRFEGESYDTIIRNNRIAGILGHGVGPHFFGVLGTGIYLYGTGSGIEITGNTIGLDANGEATLGSVNGILAADYYLGPVTDVTIGGTGPGQGNTIAGHLLNGIVVSSPVPNVRISGNSIRDNAALGIDLVTPQFVYGVTPNDALDTDAGGNGLQNFPVLTGAVGSGSALSVSGTLSSTPATEFSVEFFVSPECDAGGNGEGTLYTGSTDVTTDASGNASFAVSLPRPGGAGGVVTATATRLPEGATSEFAACVNIAESISAVGGDPRPAVSTLGPPWPNPARSGARLMLNIVRAGRHRVRVVDASGRVVATILDDDIDAGSRVLRWDGCDASGRPAASGVYFVRLDDGSPARTVTLVR